MKRIVFWGLLVNFILVNTAWGQVKISYYDLSSIERDRYAAINKVAHVNLKIIAQKSINDFVGEDSSGHQISLDLAKAKVSPEIVKRRKINVEEVYGIVVRISDVRFGAERIEISGNVLSIGLPHEMSQRIVRKRQPEGGRWVWDKNRQGYVFQAEAQKEDVTIRKKPIEVTQEKRSKVSEVKPAPEVKPTPDPRSVLPEKPKQTPSIVVEEKKPALKTPKPEKASGDWTSIIIWLLPLVIGGIVCVLSYLTKTDLFFKIFAGIDNWVEKKRDGIRNDTGRGKIKSYGVRPFLWVVHLLKEFANRIPGDSIRVGVKTALYLYLIGVAVSLILVAIYIIIIIVALLLGLWLFGKVMEYAGGKPPVEEPVYGERKPSIRDGLGKGYIRDLKEGGYSFKIEEGGYIRDLKHGGTAFKIEDSGYVRDLKHGGMILKIEDSGYVRDLKNGGMAFKIEEDGYIRDLKSGKTVAKKE